MNTPDEPGHARTPVVLVADAGVAHIRSASADPIADWLDLMAVVEALCPTSPPPEPPHPEWLYRL